MFKKVLIANRGEIAVRLIRACREMRISPVAVFSEADTEALHVKLADEAVPIGPASAGKSYLSFDRILGAARTTGAEAIHPGYGFLAENAGFASACQETGIVFIGPSPRSIELMGDKIASRRAMIAAGVPVVPGTDTPAGTVEEAISFATGIGYPLMIKATAGGGGKGMRVVRSDEELRRAFEQARSEAETAFGNPAVFLEKYLERPRHIEVQVLGDQQGHRIHLGERECSIQRRHQKIVEESPSPLVDKDLRMRLGKVALRAADAVDYYSAGTVEMLVDDSGDVPSVFFLEMNTRLQVEHPVTELVTGVDLAVEQIRIADGQPLRSRRSLSQPNGWALEFRIYAEDPENGFLPAPGRIVDLHEPGGPGVRVDSGVECGFEIPIHYDPLIAKLITHGRNRAEALDRMRRALSEYRVAGVRTNLKFFQALLDHPEFLSGRLSTDFIDRHGILESLPQADERSMVPVLAAAIEHAGRHVDEGVSMKRPERSQWRESGRIGRSPLRRGPS